MNFVTCNNVVVVSQVLYTAAAIAAALNCWFFKLHLIFVLF